MLKKRRISNNDILDFMSKIFKNHPELRFVQILNICDIDSDRDFYEEPSVTLEKLKTKFPNLV